MASLTQDVKEELAKELEVVATWVEGPRKTKALALAHRIRGLDADEAIQKANEQIAAQDAPTDLSEQKAAVNDGTTPPAQGDQQS